MKLTSFEAIMDALNRKGVRYLLVGGMAVVAHGYGRMTADIDLVVQLKRDNILKALEALAALGFHPRAPVKAEQFADEETRKRWIRAKGMVVFALFSEAHRETPVDVFVSEPFDFDATYNKAVEADVNGVKFLSVDRQTLIDMKLAAGRPLDLQDVRQLRMLAGDEK